MPLPGTQEIRKPLLEAFKGEAPRNFSINEILEIIAEYYGLNLNDFSTGDKNIFKSRINEAKSYLRNNNLLYNPSGNTYMITNAGTEILEDNPEIISDEYLKSRGEKLLTLPENEAAIEDDTSDDTGTSPEQEITLNHETNDTDTPPEIDTLTDTETSTDFDADTEAESLTDNEPAIAQDTPPEIDSLNNAEPLPEFDAATESETLADNETPTAQDTPSEVDVLNDAEIPTDFDAGTESESFADDETPTAQDIPPEIDSLNDSEALPEFDAATESETLADDEPPTAQDTPSEVDVLNDAEIPTDFDADSESDITLDDETFTDNETQSEDFAGQELDNAPEENLDTEEVYTDTMPEDTYELNETQEDLTPETESQPETVQENEENYDPELLAAAIQSDSIDDAIAKHNSELADQLLMKTAGLPSDRFEMLVIDLLSKMGYFAFQTARYTTESSGSGLIDGVILDNKTGTNIYIQAQKLSPGRTVSKADIQDFVDELADKGGKGLYATTASFSENAKILAADERLMLIDGEKLANLMIANNFCVNVEKVYEVKAIDTESFSEYE